LINNRARSPKKAQRNYADKNGEELSQQNEILWIAPQALLNTSVNTLPYDLCITTHRRLSWISSVNNYPDNLRRDGTLSIFKLYICKNIVSLASNRCKYRRK